MKRVTLVLAAAAVMAMLMAVSAAPAMAAGNNDGRQYPKRGEEHE
jgi:hypothetical protein